MGLMHTPVHILLVEDDEVDVMNLKRAFTKNRISNPLTVAGNGLEALEKLRNGEVPHPRICLLDLNMPKMGGIEFLHEVRKEPELMNLTVFIMTTSNEESDKLEAYNLNVAGYIVKPLSMSKFIESVGVLGNFWQLCEFPEQS
ncbi:MAG: response regulator [Leptolyngbya sp. SIO3F4]|nr:response regulator [Leptolyngbya sp. SIO3F4]